MPSQHPTLRKRPPTRIKRTPTRGQLPLFSGGGSAKPERLRARRRRARLITTGALVVFTALGVWTLGLLSYNERVTIAEVQVVGADKVSEENVEKAFDSALHDGSRPLFSRANIFLYPRKDIVAELLQKFPRLQTVSVERTALLSQAVVVTVQEREPRHEWCNGGCYLLDQDGFIFAPSSGETGGYAFRGGLLPGEEPIGQHFLRGRLDRVVGFLDELGRVGFPARGATVESEKDMSVELAAGLTLKVAFGSDFGQTMRNFELAVVSEALKERLDELEYIDLRFGNRLYYKFKGATEEVSMAE